MGWGGVLRRLLGERLARLARRIPLRGRRQREFSPEDLEDAGLNTGVPRPSEWLPDPPMDPYRLPRDQRLAQRPPEGPELQQREAEIRDLANWLRQGATRNPRRNRPSPYVRTREDRLRAIPRRNEHGHIVGDQIDLGEGTELRHQSNDPERWAQWKIDREARAKGWSRDLPNWDPDSDIYD